MIKVSNYKLKYNENSNISFTVNDGEVVCLTGANGTGKTTILKMLGGLLKPNKKGEVVVNGLDLFDDNAPLIVHKNNGYIFQNPDDQIVFDDLTSELAFGPENQCEDIDKIKAKIDYFKDTFLIPEKTNVSMLSGGERQRLAAADIFMMDKDVFLMDEITSMQDKYGRQSVMEFARLYARNQKKTIIYVSQNNADLIYADRVLSLKKRKDGCIVCVEQDMAKIKQKAAKVKDSDSAKKPNVNAKKKGKLKIIPLFEHGNNEEELTFNSVYYSQGDVSILNNFTYTFQKSSLYLVNGRTGQGKTTLGRLMNATLSPDSGYIECDGIEYSVGGKKSSFIKNILGDKAEKEKLNSIRKKVGYVLQYPEKGLFQKTVLLDVMFGPKNLGMKENEAREKAIEALGMLNIGEEFYNRKTEELSGAEKRLVAFAGILAMDTEYIVLDEIFAGLDKKNKELVKNLMYELVERGKCVISLGHEVKL